MFTVRPHPPKGPSSAPFTSPGGAVVAFGGRFPALFLLLWACPCTFVCLLLCTLFLGICAPGLSAVELYFFAFALVVLLGWAAPPPHIRGSSPRSVGRWLWSFSVSRSFPRPALCSLLLGAPFFLGPSFFLVPSPPLLSALWPVFLLGSVPRPPARLSSLSLLFLLVLLLSLFPLRFCSLLLGTSFLFGPSLFLVALFPYIFLFIFIYFDLSA